MTCDPWLASYSLDIGAHARSILRTLLLHAHLINSARVIHVLMAHKISYTRPCTLQAQRVLHFSASFLL